MIIRKILIIILLTSLFEKTTLSQSTPAQQNSASLNSGQQSRKGIIISGQATEYAKLAEQLEYMMPHAVDKKYKKLGGRDRNVFVPWIRDHVHVMKAMKFMEQDMTSFLEFYLETQTAEGIYFDYYYPINAGGINDRMKLFDKRFWAVYPADSIQMHRLPVEADLEYLVVEGVHAVWQSTGDTAFVRKWLPNLVRGINYSMTDPLRWSSKYQLMKRGYTLDTWDFLQLPMPRKEYKEAGLNIQKGIFNIDSETPMGIMHGDNSGLYAACNQLSELFAITGNKAVAAEWQSKAEGVRNRANKLCWNGKYYAHFVQDDPQPAYLKMDQKNTLSLSNPYDVNRGLPTRPMAQSIVNTYRELFQKVKSESIAEWYGVYPAVQPHFADYKPGSYMNGGVNTIVGGELAKAAFTNGYETYGIDILNRIMDLIKKHNGDLPVSYTPEGKPDPGIPDNWGQAAVYSAIVEGLAGIVDKSTQFRDVEISPRWLAAGKDSVSVKLNYGPTGKTIGYDYLHQPKAKKITLRIDGDLSSGVVKILLPVSKGSTRQSVNGKSVKAEYDLNNQSRYAVIRGLKGKDMLIELSY